MSAPCAQVGFAALLRRILVDEQNRRLKDVAEEVGMDARNFYGRVNGRINFTPEEINRVLRVVPDPRLGECLLAHTPLICAPRVDPAPRDPGMTAVDYASHAVEETVAALRGVMQLFGTAEESTAEQERTERHIVAAQQQLAALRMSLLGIGGRRVEPGHDAQEIRRSGAAASARRRVRGRGEPGGRSHHAGQPVGMDDLASEQLQ